MRIMTFFPVYSCTNVIKNGVYVYELRYLIMYLYTWSLHTYRSDADSYNDCFVSIYVIF